MQGELPPTAPSLCRKLGIGSLHVFVLSSLAIAQPIYDLLGRNAEFFVARGSKPVDLVALILVFSLGLPAVLAGGLLLSRAFGVVCYTVTFAVLQIVLVAMILLPPIKVLGDLLIATLIPVGCGLLFALSYRKLRAVPRFMTALSPVILVFPAYFVFATPASKVAFPKNMLAEEAGFSVPPRSHVVFLVLDLLPVTALMDENQNLDAKRYPGFARLQAGSVWFRQARTVSQVTLQALPALLTGRYPRPRTLPMLEEYPRNLFTLFGTAGDIHAYEPLTRLCPEALCGATRALAFPSRLGLLVKDTTIVLLHLLFPQRYASWLPPIDSQWGSFERTVRERAGDAGDKEPKGKRRARLEKEFHQLAANLSSYDRVRKFEIFLDGLGGRASRNLSFLHLDLPHGPFLYLASGKKYVPEDKAFKRLRLQAALGRGAARQGRAFWGPDPYLAGLAYQRLTHQIVLADKLVGQLLDRLEDLGILDRSLLIVTADHGQSYEPGGALRSLKDADTAHVPLFIKFPGQREGSIDDRAVESVDILPTIVDVLDLNIDWQFEGYSLAAGSADESAIEHRGRPELERDLATHLRLKLDRVGTGSIEILGLGPHRRLVGRQVVDALATARDDEMFSRFDDVQLDQEALLKDVDTSSGFIPAYLTGSVELGEESPPIDLAIALNGVIRTTLTTYQDKQGVTRFATMVPEASFVAGNNPWAVYRFHSKSRPMVPITPPITAHAKRLSSRSEWVERSN